MSADLYPPGPTAVPPELTRPTSAYRRHAYLALLGLLIFMAAYFALAAWFGYVAYIEITRAMHDGRVVNGIVGGASGFLSVFMWTALFFVRRGERSDDLVEVTPAQHPSLFAFLHRVADEVKAPRPHKVFLSARVNAAVFYDLSLINLILPSKKNLEIGIGLVNTLTLGELKAVLAHEFGHFAQKTMAVGRYVYIGQQIAGHIVVKRGKFDGFLRGISNTDVRIAWFGWILRLIVWSIRSLVDTAFGFVVLAHKALSREMEFQADLVAVSLTGSDALIHALHRLQASDDAMDSAIGFAMSQRAGGKAVEDVFAVQSELLAKRRTVRNDPLWGQVPALPAVEPEKHRVFEQRMAQPPRMWSTHPANEMREQNCKKVYVACPLDDRSGWVLFTRPGVVKKAVTARLYAAIDAEEEKERSKELEPMTAEVATAVIGEIFERSHYNASYRGVYLGRTVTRNARTVDAMFQGGPSDGDLRNALARCYPDDLPQQLAKVRSLALEHAMLKALHKGFAEAPGGKIQHRGRVVRRRDLAGLVTKVDAELTAASNRIEAHDRDVRATHFGIAKQLAHGWPQYHHALVQLMHFTDHRSFDLQDAIDVMNNVLRIVLADRKVTKAEAERATHAAAEVYDTMRSIFADAKNLSLTPILRAEMEIDSDVPEMFGAFNMPHPTMQNLGEWLDRGPRFARNVIGFLTELHVVALDELLRVESEMARIFREGGDVPDAPPSPRVPAKYPTRIDGQERPQQEQLDWWDRFQVADGFVPGLLRTAVAGSIVGSILWITRGL